MSHSEFINIGTPEDRIIEECSEIIKAVIKARRFGYFNHHPDRPHRTNIDEIKAEIDDCIEAFESFEKYLMLIQYHHFKIQN